jgi:cytochrome b subunit of formate dehydrogenase
MAGSFSPTSAIFAVSNLGVKILLAALVLGIAFGLLRSPFFRARPEPTDATVQRHSVGTRWMHWLNALAFLLAIYTAAIFLRWIGNPLSLPTVYVLHYIAAAVILFTVGAVTMNALSYGTTSRHRLIPTAADLREFGAEFAGYLGLRGGQGFLGFFPTKRQQPPVPSSGDKYLATERVASYPLWVLIVGVLVVTGLIKALRYIYPIPHSWLSVVTPVHDIAGYAAVVMLVFHAGAVLLIRTNWPLLRSMFSGREDMAYAQQHNAEWLKQIEEGEEKGGRPIGRPGPVTPSLGHHGPSDGED